VATSRISARCRRLSATLEPAHVVVKRAPCRSTRSAERQSHLPAGGNEVDVSHRLAARSGLARAGSYFSFRAFFAFETASSRLTGLAVQLGHTAYSRVPGMPQSLLNS
jgi:hypothetical protein